MQINSAYRDFIHNNKRIEVLWGGAGSAKSYTTAQKKVLKTVRYPYVKTVVARKNFITLRDSCYAMLQKVIFTEGLNDQFKFTTSPLNIKHIPTGNEFIFRGMLNEVDREKIKSIVDPTDFWLEEANEFLYDDYAQSNLRIRGDNETPKQITLTLNGVDRELWVNEKLILNPSEDVFVLNTNYTHNKFLDEAYRKYLENLINEDEYYYKVYVLGEWGVMNLRGQIYKRFINEPAPKGNIAEHKFDERFPVILCCDFNVDPMKWALIQNINGIDYVFDELVKADTDTEQMCIALRDKYGVMPFLVYGDASGSHRQTSSNTTDYQIIKQYFPNCDLRYNLSNPPVTNRINAVNWRLCNKEGKRRLYVDPSCRNVIYDLERATFKEGKREEDKSLEKYDGKNPITSLIHISSAIGYYIEKEYSLKGKPLVELVRK